MIIFAAVVLGLVIGSFLNVCIYRMPKPQSVVSPRSYCPNCKKTIPWHDNIPVLSYLLLRGRCRFCKARISPRYLIVEILTASVFVLLIEMLGLNAVTLLYIIVSCGMIVAAFVDLEYQIIPDEISIGGIVLGIVISFLYPQLHQAETRPAGLFLSLAGVLVGGGIIYITGVLGRMAFKKDAMGGGDVKYLAMMGAFLGYKSAIMIFFVAPFFGIFVGLFMKLRYKAEIIPYGPYLSLAALVVMIWGDRILQVLFPYLQ